MWEATNLSPQSCTANWPKTMGASKGQQEKRDLSPCSDTYAAIQINK